MMYSLYDLADVIRSKNSGPYELTFDIIFKEESMYRRVCEANVINPESFGALYSIPVSDVLGVIYFNPAKSIKITIVRPICSGNLGETDVYGAQQHGPLLHFSFEL